MRIKDKKILILGGTGAMGIFLVQILLKNGAKVFVSSRNRHKNRDNITYYHGNAHSLEFLNQILYCRYDAIVDFMNYRTSEFYAHHQKLLEATDQYFLISSSRVYANSERPLTEHSSRLLDTINDKKFMLSDDYALAKAREEDILFNSDYRNWTIIRPYMTYFKYRLDLGYYPKELWLYRVLKGKKIILPQEILEKKTTLTYGMDVANAIASLIGVEKALGEIFHVTQNNSYTWKEIFCYYQDVLNNAGHKVNYKIMKEPCDHDEYIVKYDRLYNRLFDNSKINGYIDTNNFKDVKNGLTMCMSEFLHSINFLNIDWKRQAHWDRLLKEKSSLTEIQGWKNKLIYYTFRYMVSYPYLRKIYRNLNLS